MRYSSQLLLTLTALLILALAGSACGQAELVQHHRSVVLGQTGITDTPSSSKDHPLVVGMGVGIWGRLSLGVRLTNGQYFPYGYSKTRKYAELLAIRTGRTVRVSLGLRVADDNANGIKHLQWRFGSSMYFEADPIKKITVTSHYRIMLHWDVYDTRYWYHENYVGLGAHTFVRRNFLLRAEWEIEWSEHYHSSVFLLGMGLVLPPML
jgi:hypothetical protein